jgi:hypothetical protein
MGFLWYPSGGVEAGIDGRLEIRNEDAEVTNLIISVQSKATDGQFDAETDTDFTFTCSERDLRYWLKGNLPVILVCSRPRTDEAYWLSIKDAFSDVMEHGRGTGLGSRKKTRHAIHDDGL